jgi:hypothetical protein
MGMGIIKKRSLWRNEKLKIFLPAIFLSRLS